MANVIIGIHGLANKPEKPTLARWWEEAIREGLTKNCGVQNADFEFIMVYWAELLYKYPRHEDPDLDFDHLYNSQPYEDAKPNALKRYDEGWLDNAIASALDVGGDVIDKLRGAIGLDAAANWLLEAKMRDLHFYYAPNRKIRGRDGRMEVARRVIMDELTNTLLPLKGRRMMLIAHSMGTIISYDVLRDLGQRDLSFPVHHFVTIGSPLGLPHVKANVHKERSYAAVPVRTPSVVTERWVNDADRRDPVAFDVHLADDYRPNDNGIRVEDDLMINDYVSPSGDQSAHKSYGYLRTPELSEHIRDFVRS